MVSVRIPPEQGGICLVIGRMGPGTDTGPWIGYNHTEGALPKQFDGIKDILDSHKRNSTISENNPIEK